MFHVKHWAHDKQAFHRPCGKLRQSTYLQKTPVAGGSPELSTPSFSDAEFAEDRIQDVVNVDATREAVKGSRSQP